MPLSRYFSGKGEKVMASMSKQYGSEKGKRVFYATANKRKKGKKRRAEMKKAMHRMGGGRMMKDSEMKHGG
jgi:hypothetical protein